MEKAFTNNYLKDYFGVIFPIKHKLSLELYVFTNYSLFWKNKDKKEMDRFLQNSTDKKNVL